MTTSSADTAVERVADAIRSEILSGAIALGSPLREEAQAERHGVSRHTVRSAFQRLVAERLAEAQPYRGVRVVSFDRDEIRALQQLRAALEGEAVRIIAERYGDTWPDELLAPAVDVLERLSGLTSERGERPEAESHAIAGLDARPPASGAARPADGDVDWLEVERLHADFHRAIVAASASPRIIEAHDALGSELLLFLLHVRPHYTLEAIIDEHRELLVEIQAQGPEAMREHLGHSTDLLLGQIDGSDVTA
ncbi:GntR family transcriptional regulator [Agromyces sp. S2-1-8]|uniref:GntR family transcriptional regulator n=1 Tax=Agromyces sp. S2-1-8 TaxID=2897180 RepID=UPI001E5A3700|nr:GntR family transcriptional regulator [Agromyces sp. S2-1-8]MCD5345265.1 GntR family transcriptional regulator [Agromyces sp. S2-1-8]